MRVTASPLPLSARALHWSGAAGIIFIAVLLASFIGIASRPAGLLASLWPANAVMLALLIRLPGGARPALWLAGFAGFMMADLLTEAVPWRALLLNGTNIVSIFAAWLVLRSASYEIVNLPHPMAVFRIVLAAIVAGIASGLLGALINPYLFGGTGADGFLFWGFGEVVNYVALLPMLLSAPAPDKVLARLKGGLRLRQPDLWPALMALFSFGLAMVLPGPGTIAFPVIALLWCALSYTVFPTALLTYAFSTTGLLHLRNDGLLGGVLGGAEAMELFSVRLAVTALAVAPVLLSIVMHHRKELMAELSRLARNDPLTGLLNRNAFLEASTSTLAAARAPAAALMIDIDHFKTINDSHGHAAGDTALKAVSERIVANLRPDDLIGRMGGEEFAALLPGCGPDDAYTVAERLRLAIASTPIQNPGAINLAATVSIGVSFLPDPAPDQLDAALNRADKALYSAKNLGRNRVSIAV